jgi:5,10-methylenetetrahydromethanopterin reductase
MAAFLGSIDAMTEGRAFLDMASGDSAVYNIGIAPASRARMADYITCVRDLIATGEGTYDGRPQRVRWHGEAVRKRIPITLCAEGPKTLDLGGRICDGVIAGTGLLPEVISDTIERVAAGARSAGRDPSEVEVWFTTRSSLDADRDKAIERIHASVSSILNHSMRFGLEGKNVPSQFRAKIAEYVEGYELYDHVLQAGRNPKRMAELGLTEYGLERFALAGNVDDWIERIGELAGSGASRLWLSTEAGDLDRQIHYMKVFTEQIMPHFRYATVQPGPRAPYCLALLRRLCRGPAVRFHASPRVWRPLRQVPSQRTMSSGTKKSRSPKAREGMPWISDCRTSMRS